MQTKVLSVKFCAAAALFCGLTLAGAGCSRIEKVKVVNHFNQAVRIRLEGRDTTPLVPANGEVVLNDRYYFGGGGVRVTVLTAKGQILAEDVVVPPGDSQFRSVAVVEIQP